MKIICVLLLLIVGSLAHMCLLNPHQRGSMNGIDQGGASDCALVSPAPCGGRSVESPVLFARGGSNFTFVLQKNLDHWIEGAGGNFTIRWAPSLNDEFMDVAVLPDTSAPSGSLYTVIVPLPNMNIKHGVVQAVYYPHNSEAPDAFYQCADVGILAH